MKFWDGGVDGNMSACHAEDCGFDPRVSRKFDNQERLITRPCRPIG